MENKKVDKALFDSYVSEFGITVQKHPDTNLYIYGYYTGPYANNIVWDEVNINCRGLIISDDGTIVARSFTKFFTFEKYTNNNTVLLDNGTLINIDDQGSRKIYDKPDGSLAILYWIDDKPFLATQRSFTSIKAKKATEILYTKYNHCFKFLKKDRTYLFEAIYPESQVIVNYGKSEDLILIGIIDNLTGNDLPLENIGFPVVEDMTEKLSNISGLDELQKLNLTNKEGFVILYESGLRLKIKFNWFTAAHHLLNQIIKQEMLMYKSVQQFKALMNMMPHNLTNLHVWNCLAKGRCLSTLQYKIPDVYHNLSVEEWLVETAFKLKYDFEEICKTRPGLSDIEYWELIKPSNIDTFSLKERIKESDSETIMWKRIHRIFEKFS